MKMSSLRRVTAVALAVLALLASGWAQDPGLNQDYSKASPIFPNVFAPYKARPVPAPNFTNSARIDQLLVEGKLMLSLNDAIVLALQNNLDLSIARYNLAIADTEILRTQSGASTQGVNTGIVQGTPGGQPVTITGASGSGAGGTSTAAGGAGTGTGGIVTSTLGAGPPVDSFDPVFTAGLNSQHVATPQTTTTNLVAVLNQNTGTANFQYQQAFHSGTQFTLTWNNNQGTSNSGRNYLNPVINATAQIAVRQHLLQGFSVATNTRFIKIAKNNREISDVAFRLQVMTTVAQIENIYWNLVNAYEDVKSKQRALDLANQLLENNQKQVRIGTLAPIEVVRAQSQVASASQDLIISQTNLQLQQLYMKNAVSRNLTDAQLIAAEVIPTDTMQVPAAESIIPTQDLIADALSHRPELAQAYIDLKNREINNKAARNALLPSVDLVGNYGSGALAGPVISGLPSCAGGLTVTCIPFGATTTGYGDAVSDLFKNTYPTYMVGFNVNIPIRNRTSQATQVRAQLEYRQAQMRLQQLENQIRIQVVNAQFALQQNRARVDAATKGRQLAYDTMTAEQKKYALGASTTYNVLQTQQALAAAESNLITAMTAYEQSKVSLDTATGLLLSHLGIEMPDAVTGNVKTTPRVPGVVPNATVTAAPQAPEPGKTAPASPAPQTAPAP